MDIFTTLKKAFEIDKEQFRKLEKLHFLFKEENQKINLSAIRNEDDIWIRHFYDSLLALKYFQDEKKIIDLGSGGGFPILVFSIIFPNKDFYAVESVGKKCSAMDKFASHLALKNFNILNKRAEELACKEQYREKFDMVTARAFAKFPTLLEIGLAFLKISGKLLAFRGPNNDKDDLKLAQKLHANTKIDKTELLDSEKREFWIMEKFSKTDKIFPRAVGIPKKKPLNLDFFK